MTQVMQHVDEVPDAPYEVQVYTGADAVFELYEDAGDGYDYEQGGFALVKLQWLETLGEFTLSAREGGFPTLVRERDYRVVLISKAGREEHAVRYTGQELRLRTGSGRRQKNKQMSKGAPRQG